MFQEAGEGSISDIKKRRLATMSIDKQLIVMYEKKKAECLKTMTHNVQ